MVSPNAERLRNFDLNSYIGPFWRCKTTYIPEWVPILDVPDITFRVTQDVDGDGDQETIYSEGFFDVRWEAGAIPDATLHTGPLAVSSPTCHIPVFECPDNDFGIQFAGLMSVDANYIDPASGYATRPNPPHPHGLPSEAPSSPSFAPFSGTLQLYGCNRMEGAAFYRMLYSYTPPGSAISTPPVPFVNLAWNVVSNTPPHLPQPVSADAQGWYPILPNPDDFHPEKLLLDWPTSQFVNGLYQVQMQLGDGAKNPLLTTTSISFLVDNAVPSVQFLSLAWRPASTSGGTSSGWTYFPVDLVCPVLHRQPGQDIEFRVAYSVSAPHLRDFSLSGTGCGAGTPQAIVPSAPPPVPVSWSDPDTPSVDGGGISQSPYAHRYTGESDNAVMRAAIFLVPGTDLDGAYGFTLAASSRAFSPDGGDPANPIGPSVDWHYDVTSPISSYVFLPVAIFSS